MPNTAPNPFPSAAVFDSSPPRALSFAKNPILWTSSMCAARYSSIAATRIGNHVLWKSAATPVPAAAAPTPNSEKHSAMPRTYTRLAKNAFFFEPPPTAPMIPTVTGIMG